MPLYETTPTRTSSKNDANTCPGKAYPTIKSASVIFPMWYCTTIYRYETTPTITSSIDMINTRNPINTWHLQSFHTYMLLWYIARKNLSTYTYTVHT